MSPARAAAQHLSARIGQVNRPGLGGEQRHYLAQGQVQNFIQIKRLRGNCGDGIERIQLAIAAADFIVGPALLGRVHQEALISFQLAFGITRGKAAFHRVQDGSVFAA